MNREKVIEIISNEIRIGGWHDKIANSIYNKLESDGYIRQETQLQADVKCTKCGKHDWHNVEIKLVPKEVAPAQEPTDHSKSNYKRLEAMGKTFVSTSSGDFEKKLESIKKTMTHEAGQFKICTNASTGSMPNIDFMNPKNTGMNMELLEGNKVLLSVNTKTWPELILRFKETEGERENE